MVASTNYLNVSNIIVGDDTPQNVALNLDGKNDYVQVPSTVGDFMSTQDFTVAFWVKPNAKQIPTGANTDQDILEKWDGLSSGYPFVVRYLNQNAGVDEGKIFVARYDGTNYPSLTSSVSIRDGKWHHIAFVRSSSTLTLYIDGVFKVSGTDNTAATTQNNSPLYIGSRGGNMNFFGGSIDEVRLWDIAKDEATIQAEMF